MIFMLLLVLMIPSGQSMCTNNTSSLKSLEVSSIRSKEYPQGALVRASGLCLLCNDSGESRRAVTTDMRGVEPFLAQGHLTFLHSTANANVAPAEKHRVRPYPDDEHLHVAHEVTISCCAGRPSQTCAV